MSKDKKKILEPFTDTDLHFNYLMNDVKIDADLKKDIDDLQRDRLNMEDPKPRAHSKIGVEFSESDDDDELPSTETAFNQKSIESPKEYMSANSIFKPAQPIVAKYTNTELRPSIAKSDIIRTEYRAKTPFVTESRRPFVANAAPSPAKRTFTTERPYTERKPATAPKPSYVNSGPPALGRRLVSDPKKYQMTAEQKRARARDAYYKLQDIVEKGAKLSKKYTMDDDPIEMEAEYKMHYERRKKKNSVDFWSTALLNCAVGIEIFNETQDPFDFKLKDWSKQIAGDMDRYEEIIEEIIDRYKPKDGKGGMEIHPALKLMGLIIFSGVTYHVTQKYAGTGGLGDMLAQNPKFLSNIVGITNNTKTQAPVLDNSQQLLQSIRNNQAPTSNYATTTEQIPNRVTSFNIPAAQPPAIDQQLAKQEQEFQQKMAQRELEHQKIIMQERELAQRRLEQQKSISKIDSDTSNDLDDLSESQFQDLPEMIVQAPQPVPAKPKIELNFDDIIKSLSDDSDQIDSLGITSREVSFMKTPSMSEKSQISPAYASSQASMPRLSTAKSAKRKKKQAI